jgi:hypothetical protein
MLYEPKSNLSALINNVIITCTESKGTYAYPNTTHKEWAELILAWDELGWAKCYDC